MKTLNSVQYQDLERLNQNAEEGRISSISEGDGGGQLPPVVKINEPISVSIFLPKILMRTNLNYKNTSNG